VSILDDVYSRICDRKPLQEAGTCCLHLQYAVQILEQLQQQQPDLLDDFVVEHPDYMVRLWRLCNAAGEGDAFWQILRDFLEVQTAAGYMAFELGKMEVQPAVDAWMQSGLLHTCGPEDIWMFAALLDFSFDDRERILAMFGTLALQQPCHEAFVCLGPLLLHLGGNARCRRPKGRDWQRGVDLMDVGREWNGGQCKQESSWTSTLTA
jgi:hypothetical protein